MISYLFYQLPYFTTALPYALIAFAIAVPVRMRRVSQWKKKNIQTTKWHEIGIVCFIIGLAAFSALTFFPHISFSTHPPLIRIHGYAGIYTENINLIPFRVFYDICTEVFQKGNYAYLVTNIFGNVIGFLPIGFIPPLLWRKVNFPKILLSGFLFSLFIELMQLPMGRGTDIDDLWINTLGAVLGYLLFLLFRKCFPRFTEKFKIIGEA